MHTYDNNLYKEMTSNILAIQNIKMKLAKQGFLSKEFISSCLSSIVPNFNENSVKNNNTNILISLSCNNFNDIISLGNNIFRNMISLLNNTFSEYEKKIIESFSQFFYSIENPENNIYIIRI